MIGWLIGKWHAHCRAIDLRILWPVICEETPDLDHAKAAFMLHASMDPSWRYLGDEATQIIDHLEPPDDP